MAYWLLQSNPQKWRLAEFLEVHAPEELSAWSVNRYLDQVSQDDNLALWRSGADAGVVALGHAIGPTYEAAGAADAYWEDLEQADRTRWWVPLRLTQVFLETPITREELRHDPRFAQAAILRQPFAGNPFPLSDTEWQAILDRHQASGLVDAGGPSSGWPLQPGETIRRSELHDRYGGSR